MFIILGVVALLGGLAVALFGGYVANEEDQRGLFGDRDKAEAGLAGVAGGLVLAGVGLAVLILGIVLYSIGASRARRELLATMQGTPLAPTPEPPEAPRAATPAPVARKPLDERRGLLVGGVVVAALVVLALLLLFQPGGAGELRPLFGAQAETTPPQVETFDGYVQGGGAPVAGRVNTGNSEAQHLFAPAHAQGALRGELTWTEGPTSAESLVLILEEGSGEAWSEITRGEGGPGLVVETPARDWPQQVRARVFVGGTGAADMTYTLTLTLTPGQ